MANALTIRPNEIIKPPTQKESNKWIKWVAFIFADIALSALTFYIGGFAGVIATSLNTTIESVRIGIQTIRVLSEIGFNLGMDAKSLVKRDGSVNWNIIFLDTIFILGFEGIPQIRQNIKNLKEINKLDKIMQTKDIPFEMRQVIKRYAQDFNFSQQVNNIDELAEKVYKAGKREIDESGTSTFREYLKVSELTEKFKEKNIKKQLKELFGEKFAKNIEKKEFEKQITSIQKSIEFWNEQISNNIERRHLFQSLKFTPKWVRRQLLGNNDKVKYIGLDDVKDLGKLNYFLSVLYQWASLLRYINPLIATRRLASGIWHGIRTGIKKYEKKVWLASGKTEKFITQRIRESYNEKLRNFSNKIKGKINPIIRPQLAYSNNNAKKRVFQKELESDLFARKEKLLIKAFQLIPVSSSWILGYRMIYTEVGVSLHIFFKPQATACETNDYKGKAPIITHPMSLEEISLFVNSSSKGRYYLDNFAYGFDWHKFGLIMNVAEGVAPYKIQNTLWNIMRLKRVSTTTIRSVRNIENWTNKSWNDIIKKEFVPVLSRRILTSFKVGTYLNPFVSGLIKGRSFWQMVHELGGRRTTVIVRRFRRAHHSDRISNLSPRHKNNHKRTLRRFIF